MLMVLRMLMAGQGGRTLCSAMLTIHIFCLPIVLSTQISDGNQDKRPHNHPGSDSPRNKWLTPACVIGGAIGGIAAAPFVLAGLGFTGAGVVVATTAASLMSSAGPIAAGGTFAALQSAGAAGIGATGAAIAAAAGGAVGGAASEFGQYFTEEEEGEKK